MNTIVKDEDFTSQTNIILEEWYCPYVTGVTVNVVSRNTWKRLKQQKIKCMNSKASSTKALFAHGCSKSLKAMGTFADKVTFGNQKCDAEFFFSTDSIVVSMLGYKTDTAHSCEDTKHLKYKCCGALRKLPSERT